MICTTKKQKFIAVKHLIDPDTGEKIPVIHTQIQDKDFNFHKVWLEHFIASVDSITNKKLQIAFWIIENLDKENRLLMTNRAIVEETGFSLRTVANTMKALQVGKPPFLKKIRNGMYRVNPEILWKGSHSNRMATMYEYNTTTANNKKNKTIKENTAIDEENDSEE